MIVFIDDNSPNDDVIMKFRELAFIPRIGEHITLDIKIYEVLDVYYDFSNSEMDINIYIAEIPKED